jgi:CheY-specific phosphatase CheX
MQMTAETLLKFAFSAMSESLKVYGKLDVDLGKHKVLKLENMPSVDFAGIGSFFCGRTKGTFLLCFKQESYEKLVAALTKTEFSKNEPSHVNWLSELVNSILGRVKADVYSIGHTCKIGIPAVFHGKELELFYSTKMPAQLDLIECTGLFGEFFVGVILANTDG